MHVIPKPGARQGMTVQTHPNYFRCYSERVRWLTRGEVIDNHAAMLGGFVPLGLPRFTIKSQPPYTRPRRHPLH